MPAGQPPYYNSPEEMQVKIDEYFASCNEDDDPITITGLALALGFTSRRALINYEGYSEQFFHTIKRAKSKVEHAYEKRLIKRGNGGDVFALKNFDWTDKQEIQNLGGDGLPIDPPNKLIIEHIPSKIKNDSD